jgi:hypothetical protein
MGQPSKIWKIYFFRSIELEQVLGKDLFYKILKIKSQFS